MIEVIFDTDPGVDDAMALAFLAAHPSIRLKAVTTVFGNADVERTTRNALYLTRAMGVDCPVYGGAAEPLCQPRNPSPRHVHGEDGLGDAGKLAGFDGAPASGAADERIVELIRAHPHRLTLLAVAPLTNLARALRIDPAIAGMVKNVIVMGGAFGWGAYRGTASPVAESNMHNDPHAADIVLSADWPVTVVGLDVTASCVFGAARARGLAESAGDVGRLLWDISRNYEAIYRQLGKLDGCCLHDVAAAICMVEPDLFTFESGPLRVVTDGIAAGQTIQKPEGMPFPPGPWDGLRSQRAAKTVEAEHLIEIYTSALSRHYGGA